MLAWVRECVCYSQLAWGVPLDIMFESMSAKKIAFELLSACQSIGGCSYPSPWEETRWLEFLLSKH